MALLRLPRTAEERYYHRVIDLITEGGVPFLLAGTYAVRHYVEIGRATKDLDIFCRPGDYLKLLKLAADAGYEVEIIDDRWLAKIKYRKWYVDVIFGSVTGTWPISDSWFETAPWGEIFGHPVRITPLEELIVSKAYRMRRNGFDGADVAHLLLQHGESLDWKRLLNKMDMYWEVLLTHIILFRFIYPSERERVVPKWILDELMSRVAAQMELPTPQDKVSRGLILSTEDFKIDIEQWGFRDMADYKVTSS